MIRGSVFVGVDSSGDDDGRKNRRAAAEAARRKVAPGGRFASGRSEFIGFVLDFMFRILKLQLAYSQYNAKMLVNP